RLRRGRRCFASPGGPRRTRPTISPTDRACRAGVPPPAWRCGASPKIRQARRERIMKGVIFTEFVDYAEARFGAQAVTRLLQEGGLASGGRYSAVGSYDHRELFRIVEKLSATQGAE